MTEPDLRISIRGRTSVMPRGQPSSLPARHRSRPRPDPSVSSALGRLLARGLSRHRRQADSDMTESGSVPADGRFFPRVFYRKIHDVSDSLVMLRCREWGSISDPQTFSALQTKAHLGFYSLG